MGSEGEFWPSGGVRSAVSLNVSQHRGHVELEAVLMASRMCSRARPPFL